MESLVENVLAPYSLQRVLNKIVSQNAPIAIATDASNKGNRKFFPVGVRYFDLHGKILNYSKINCPLKI